MTEGLFPQAFIKREQSHLGAAWVAFVKAHQQPPPVSIRYNPSKWSPANMLTPVPWASHATYLRDRPSFTLDPTFHAGAYYVQEASSMFLEQAFKQTVSSNSQLNVLDLCAAPGGKSTHLLNLLAPDSLLVSNDAIRSRASILSENIQKWGHNNVVVTNNDPADFQRLPGFFDVIVVDAPCSGEGLFRKDPGAMKEWSEENVLLCSKRQRRILADVWPSLKSGGILIYSTCTYNEFENEENIAWLHEQNGIESISLRIQDDWNIDSHSRNGIHGYRFFPHRVKGEGFFMTVVRKTEAQSIMRLSGKSKFLGPAKKIKERLSDWVLKPDQKTFILRNDSIQCFPTEKMAAIETLVQSLHVVTAGTYLAMVKHEKLIPEHALAVSIELNRSAFNASDLEKEDALQFLRKENFLFPLGEKGFSLVTYQNIPLGWVNVLDNRINNLYPSEWRIRMGKS